MAIRMMRAFFIVLLAALAAGCGYHIAGKGGQMPGGVASVSIPIFTNSTGKPDIEAAMTSAFSIEFLTTVNVVKDNADAVLKGNITSYSLVPVAFSKDDVNQAYRLTVVIAVSLVKPADGAQAVLWEDSYITDFEDFMVTLNDISATRDKEAEAFRKLARDTARLTKERLLERF